MSINRVIWKNPFTTNDIPAWKCPVCNTGILRGKPENFKIQETKESLREHAHSEWEPSFVRGIFNGLLTCNNPRCYDYVAVTGIMTTEEYYYTDRDSTFFDTLHLISFFPTIHVFEIIKEVKSPIQEAIIDAFKVFWIDNSSCANKIRTVVELIMDNQKVSTHYLNKGKRYRHSTHKRIELFKSKNAEAADIFMAVKWIGNTGSHSREQLTRDDVLDGMEMLEHAIYKLYETETKRIRNLAKTINKAKGPRRKK